MRYLLLVIFCCWTGMVMAQEEEQKPPSQASFKYREMRTKITTPPYGLAKIKALMKSIQEKDDVNAITFKQWQDLSLREKFTYCMINPEIYSQNCDGFPEVDEEKKIFAQLPIGDREQRLSERQFNFLKDNRDSVLALITESINRTGYIGLNYKEVLVELNARHLIPFLIQIYNKTKKDGDILTVLNLLMKRNEYPPFMESASYKKLYEGDSYRASINYNAANEELIIKRATEFYQSTQK